MSIRKWKREMVHRKMEKDGIKRINKPYIINNHIYPSYFATHWRTYKEK